MVSSKSARFFLHIFGQLEAPDEESAEYADLWAAREAAIENVRDLLGEQIHVGYLNLDGYIHISSDAASSFCGRLQGSFRTNW